MKIINWFNPERDQAVKSLFPSFWTDGNGYEADAKDVARQGYYLPRDQHALIMKLLDTQVDLDIGDRQVEWKSPAELQSGEEDES